MAEELTRMICITCPVGCLLKVTHEGKTIIKVEGHECKKGIDYAERELTDPRRMVFTVVRVRNGFHPVVPVRFTKPVPKAAIFKVLEVLREVELEAPVKLHQVVLADAAGTGIDVIASRNLPAS
ncbi:DUF1667 domain-containing protein [Dehalococcoidia bacterium]|nr:DUF1667 domain-containing protein [Dehalococcoidia bacterium]